MRPYYDDGCSTIYHGDCLEVLPSIGRADLVLTDPPFYLPANISAVRKQWRRSLGEVAIMEGYFRGAWSAIVDRLRPTGAIYTFSDSTSYAVFLASLYPLFDRTHCLVWDKGSGGLGNGWRHSHELIVHGAWSTTEYAKGFRRDVLAAGRVASDERDHASQKPVDPLSQLLAAHPKGVVLDPFMGSGATLRAAKEMGWKAIGVEVEEAYCESAVALLGQGVLPLGEEAS